MRTTCDSIVFSNALVWTESVENASHKGLGGRESINVFCMTTILGLLHVYLLEPFKSALIERTEPNVKKKQQQQKQKRNSRACEQPSTMGATI